MPLSPFNKLLAEDAATVQSRIIEERAEAIDEASYSSLPCPSIVPLSHMHVSYAPHAVVAILILYRGNLQIHRDIVRVKELFSDLSVLIKEQEMEIQDIYKNVDETHAKTEVALGQIIEASQLQKEGCVVS
jgi:phosphoribosyl-ATP pyrophosphohydrolase